MEFTTQPTSPSTPSRPSSAKNFILETLETIAIALAIFLFIYFLVAQPHLVKGESMQPNFIDGEYILTSKVYKWWGTPQRGDVIVLKSPDDKSVQFIKRIIGLPGEKIEVTNNHITIFNTQHPDGYVLNESYLSAQILTEGKSFLPEGQTYTIPLDHYIVMGDNRTYSYDSRTWGTLDKNDIIGKAFFIYWPLNKFGFVAHATYK
jgi:signal peptidase I